MDELKNIAPKLSKLKKEVPFTTPDNYFNDFSERLEHTIQSNQRNNEKSSFSIIKFCKPIIGLAASFALIFLIVYKPIKSFLPKYIAITNSSVKKSFTEPTFLNFIEKIDENSFFLLIYEPSSDKLNTINLYNDKEILNYLSSYITDYEIYLQSE